MRIIMLCLYSLLSSCVILIAQEHKKMQFSEIENGLFNTWISCIEQDAKGFIWVGTQDGLHRYDGYSFEVFRNSAENVPSLGANWAHNLVIDSKDNYWIGTYGAGLVKFSPENMTFENFGQGKTKESLRTIVFQTLLLDDNLIVSSSEKGFQIRNTQTDSVKSLGFGDFDSPVISSGEVLWLAENQKLYTYNLQTEERKLVYTFSSRINVLEQLPNEEILVALDDKVVLFDQHQVTKELSLDGMLVCLIPDMNGSYFAATSNSLFKFNVDSFGVETLHVDVNFSNLNIQTLFLDRQGSLWVGTDKGLFRERKYNKAFMGEGIAIHARRIVKHKDNLYLAGDQGLFKVHQNRTSSQLVGSPITALFDQGNMLVAGSINETIYKIRNDSLYQTISKFSQNNDLMVHGLAVDKNQRLWAGSWDGLLVFNEQNELLKSIPLESHLNQSDSKIISLHIDSKDRIWIITAALGIYMIEDVSAIDLGRVPEKIINFRSKKGDPHALTSNIIMTLEEDQQGQMWFGTDLGVVKYLEDTGTFSRLQYQNRLFDKKVMALRKDAMQNLWISTINDGLFVYSKEKKMRHFTKNDGLISDAFLFGSGLYDEKSNRMYFGTDEGVQIIDLTQPFSNTKDKTSIVTNFQVNNADGKTIIPPSQAPFLQKISLEPFQNDFSIRFSAMDFVAPEKICYAYSMDDTPWKITDLQTAYFTNLPHGRHVLKFKALHDGIATNTNISTLDIYIKPPWYYSRLAKIIYLILVLAAALGIYQYLKWRWRMHYNLKLKEEEAARLKLLNDQKSKLYTNIAHEFKNPLTLIAGPIDHKLREGNISDQDLANFSIVRRNANRLTFLVDQLLELASLESGKLTLSVDSGNLGLFLNILSKSFEYQAQTTQVSYTIEVAIIDEAWYDEDIIEKIVTNLLSNAFKYVPDYGKCWFLVKKSKEFVEISVKNTVRNGAELRLDKLFTRFYQNNSYSEGIGVGLALVKELVSFYGGSVDVALEEDEIIHFSVKLPFKRNSFREEDIVGAGFIDKANAPENHVALKTQAPQILKGERPLLLIVEDHVEIRSFVKQALQGEYRILEAENGINGLEIALEQIPDIILSDIRMPRCSGIELCNALKIDEKTSHIPIILLTGDSGEEYELRGLDSGADDFVTKPFKMRILEKRLRNLIGQRKKLRELYSKELILKPKGIAISPTDEIFLNKVQEILDEHLYDSSFNSEIFSQKALMSRMQLHRKLLAYTGLSTSAFIRSQRLKQAVQLLETSDININEIAYASGFNTPTYFMKCFKEAFKKTPSEYLQSLQD